MKRIAIAATCAAIAGLAACTSTATTSVSQSAVSVPVGCGQRYQAWDNGPGNGLVATLDTVSAATTAGDLQTLKSALRKAKPAISRAARAPMPACADPRGFWSVLLMHVNAAEGSTGSAAALRAATKDVPAIEQQLTAELRQTAGIGGDTH